MSVNLYIYILIIK